MMSPSDDDNFKVKVIQHTPSKGKIVEQELDEYAVSEEHTINKVREERKTFFMQISVSSLIVMASFVMSIIFLALHVWQRWNQRNSKHSKEDEEAYYAASAGFFAGFCVCITLFVCSVLYCLAKTILIVLLAEHDRTLLKRRMTSK
ncbi:hypothetical protein FDP41_001735 [Naegleria fowleri]|uniref:Uncharacterized protein n=1 Tax=Naegleria fowleri TaxID=5763 RepID=A0A6A5BXM4_NAEFO|nr:uncharacterized protein FDP41_001735 [Naegleria fowleri]KAF0979392.1 hypothetical protein FDP41_001735 [Naegleria fowleri]CAG4709881.1 unnamed protein product [Naegleria fowleri]